MPKPRLVSPPAPQPDIDARAALTAIIELLEREQQLLARPQADALEAIAVQKRTLLNQLEVPARGAQALRDDPALRALVMHAQQLNAANARLLALHRNSCESRLQLLRGGESASTLYRANGYLGA